MLQNTISRMRLNYLNYSNYQTYPKIKKKKKKKKKKNALGFLIRRLKSTDGMANSVDPDHTALYGQFYLGLNCLLGSLYPNTLGKYANQANSDKVWTSKIMTYVCILPLCA